MCCSDCKGSGDREEHARGRQALQPNCARIFFTADSSSNCSRRKMQPVASYVLMWSITQRAARVRARTVWMFHSPFFPTRVSYFFLFFLVFGGNTRILCVTFLIKTQSISVQFNGSDWSLWIHRVTADQNLGRKCRGNVPFSGKVCNVTETGQLEPKRKGLLGFGGIMECDSGLPVTMGRSCLPWPETCQTQRTLNGSY